jgi:Uma2 family endonuclease
MAPAVMDLPPKPNAKLLTAEEYGAMPDLGRNTELVNGEVIEMPSPGFRHGVVCVNIALLLAQHVRPRQLGRVVSNDSGVKTAPHSVRGADVAYFSYERLPKHENPRGYPAVSPEVVFEVMSPDDVFRDVLGKVDEYLAVGVDLVYVVDPDREQAALYRKSEHGIIFRLADELIFPGVLPELRVPLRAVLE